MIQNSKITLTFLLYICFSHCEDELFNILGFSSSMHATCMKHMAVGRPQGSLGLPAGQSPPCESSPCSRQTWWLGTGIFWFLHECLFPKFIQLTLFLELVAWFHILMESLLLNSIYNSILLLFNQKTKLTWSRKTTRDTKILPLFIFYKYMQ